jgi:hypothetical protein
MDVAAELLRVREGNDVDAAGAYVFSWRHEQFSFTHELRAEPCAFAGCETLCVLTRPFCSNHCASERGVALEGREHGMTVVTTRAVEKNELIVEVLGELLDWESVMRRYGDGRRAPLLVRVFRTSLYADAAIERSVGGMVRTSSGAHHNCKYVVKARADEAGSAGLWIAAMVGINAGQELLVASATSTVADAGGSRRHAGGSVRSRRGDTAAAAAAAAYCDVDALSSDDDVSPPADGNVVGDRWTTYNVRSARPHPPCGGSVPDPRSERDPRSEPLRETCGYGEVQPAAVGSAAARERLKKLFVDVKQDDEAFRQHCESRDGRCVICAIYVWALCVAQITLSACPSRLQMYSPFTV